MELNEKTLGSELIFDGRILEMRLDNVELQNGNKATREYVCHSGGAGILPVTNDGRVALVKQFRYPYKEVIYEIPAGKIDRVETHLETAKRELAEEVGGLSNEIIELGIIYPTPAYTNEKIYIFLALNTTFDKQKLDEDEFLDVEYMEYSKAIQMVDDNIIKDSKTIIALLRAKKYLNL